MYSTREAFNAYVFFMAMKKHFTDEKYDFIKYNGKIRANPQTFETKKDKFFYYKLSKRKDYKEFVISNLVEKPNVWVGDLMNDDKYEDVYSEWLKKQQSLSYMFQNDLSELDDDFATNLEVVNGQHPKLLKAYVQSRINLESLVILCDITNAFKNWDKNIKDTIVYPNINKLCVKYKPFLTYDKEKMKKIVVDTFT
jgi:hypothetical protein